MSEYQFRQFERNRYFPGKTLTVRDFKAEQEYYNNKRQILNRLVHGTGVLWGLQVTTDGETVFINPGMALDCLGREIIVSNPVKLHISEIEGSPTPDMRRDREAALCIEYSDDKLEPVETANNVEPCCKESFEYNRIKEKYKLSIRQNTNPENVIHKHILTRSNKLNDDSTVSLVQTTPAWVSPNELFPVKITVDRNTEKACSIVLKPNLSNNLYFNDDSSKEITINVNNTDKVFTEEFYVRALPMQNGSMQDASVRLDFSVKCHGAERKWESSLTNSLKVLETSISDEIIDSFFKGNPVIDTGDKSVKLAGLKLVRKNNTIKIDEITNPSSGGFVYGNDILYELLRNLEMRFNAQKYPLEIKTTSASLDRPDPDVNMNSRPSADVVYRQKDKHLEFDFSLPKEMATGIVYFDIESEILMAGDNGITEIINPELGRGPVYVNVEWEQCRYRDKLVPKDSVVFGAYPNCQDGTFRIWYKVIRDIQIIEDKKTKTIHKLHFRWWAFSNVHDKGESEARRFVITPKHVMIKMKNKPYTLEFKDLKAKFKNQEVTDISWEVLPYEPSIPVTGVAIYGNRKINFPADINSQSFILKGKYRKENLYDKIVVTVVNEGNA